MNNKKKYRALMLDLDGTTVPNRKDGMPSEKVLIAVEKASKLLQVSVVTGRPYYDCGHIIKELNLSGPSIVAGGAEIRDSKTKDILWSRTITDSIAVEILDYVEKNNLKMIVADYGYYEIPKLYDPKFKPNKAYLLSIPDLPELTGDSFMQELKYFKEIAAHKVIGWKEESIWLQITHSEATKQHGIFEVAKLLGIETHEIIGVGDSYNDFPLLMACGLKVAMGNAADDLKAIADYIAPSVDDDGVADVIEKFVLN